MRQISERFHAMSRGRRSRVLMAVVCSGKNRAYWSKALAERFRGLGLDRWSSTGCKEDVKGKPEFCDDIDHGRRRPFGMG